MNPQDQQDGATLLIWAISILFIINILPNRPEDKEEEKEED